MKIIGVDLAWAEHNRTGVCAVDGGRVIDSGTVGDDDELVAWIAPYAERGVIVAFDAPLIVRNRTGCRGPERVIASAWGAAHASCYPANLGRPWFAKGGRAHRLARRLRLETDPAVLVTGATRIAIEVYPHTALVSLFGLAAVLKYKAGRARSVDARRREFGRLLDCLLVLRDASPGLDVTASRSWARVATMVARAKTNAALDRVEDELDAYVCAYVGAHYGARRGTRDCVVIGDARQGYVVTPVDATRWDTVRAAAGRYAVPIA